MSAHPWKKSAVCLAGDVYSCWGSRNPDCKQKGGSGERIQSADPLASKRQEPVARSPL